MRFHIANNWISSQKDLENNVMTASDFDFPKTWIFDCESAARIVATKLNKSYAEYGYTCAVACIIE